MVSRGESQGVTTPVVIVNQYLPHKATQSNATMHIANKDTQKPLRAVVAGKNYGLVNNA